MGELGHRQKHLDNDCELVEVKCLHVGCSFEPQRRDLAQHLKDCDYREVLCEYCGEGVIFVRLDEHVNACDSVPVPCPYGCKDNILRGNMTQHEAICTHLKVTCLYEGCLNEVQRRNLGYHLKDCGYRKVPCEYCNEGVVFIHMDEHVDACDSVSVPCPNGCSDNVIRGRSKKHFKHVCTHLKVKCLHEGCSYEPQRRNLGQHLKDCDYREVPCEYCGEGVIFFCMDEHVGACDSVPVPCPHGCSENILRGSLTQHDDKCTHLKVTCLHEGCFHEAQRRNLDQHMKDCDYREVPCEYCGEGVIYIDMDEHVSACDSVPVPCPNGCKDNIIRGNLTQHEQVCLMAVISCPFAGIGCDHGHITREALTAHMEEFQQRHVIMMGQTLLTQQQEIARLSLENSKFSQENADLKKGTAKVSWIIKDIMSKLSLYQKSERVACNLKLSVEQMILDCLYMVATFLLKFVLKEQSFAF
jgi:hypothetical protein